MIIAAAGCTLDSLGGMSASGGAGTAGSSTSAGFMATAASGTPASSAVQATTTTVASQASSAVDASSSTGVACPDQVAQLDGVDDVLVHLGTGYAIPMTHAFAVGAWVKPGAVNAEATIASGAVDVNSGPDSKLRLGLGRVNNRVVALFEVEQGGTTCRVTGATEILSSRWTHVIGNLADAEIAILIDGVVDAVDTTCNLTGDGTTTSLRAGGDCSGGGCWGPYRGLIDDVAFWSTPFDPGPVGTVRFTPAPSPPMACDTAGTMTNVPVFLVDMEGAAGAQTFPDRCTGTEVVTLGAGVEVGMDDPTLVIDSCQPGM